MKYTIPGIRGHGNRKLIKFLAILILSFLFLLAPQLWLIMRYENQIYRETQKVSAREYGIVFGARVGSDFALRDVTRERVEAAILLYKQGTIKKLFISGDNRHNLEAESIADYAKQHGVTSEHIVVDHLGIDTQDTCRHFSRIANEGVLFTQAYHLPRAIYLCEREGVQAVGLMVNRLGILKTRGDNLFTIYGIRFARYMREAFLTWAVILGIYDQFSNEAELREGIPPQQKR